jgi:hypothetical protein
MSLVMLSNVMYRERLAPVAVIETDEGTNDGTDDDG